MTDDSAQVLRRLRQARNLSQRELARHAHVGVSLVAQIETGERNLTRATAGALDRALKTSVLTLWVEGDTVQRRNILRHLGILGAVAGTPGAGAELLRLRLIDRAQEPVDWDSKILTFRRDLASDPSPEFATALHGALAAVEQLMVLNPSHDLLKYAAELALLYGLWWGNEGDLAAAESWYLSSIDLAERSRDTTTLSWTWGRSLSRRVYEGWSIRQTLDGIDRVLTITKRPTPGTLEAYAALVSVHAITGDVRAGRQAVTDMREIAGQLDDPEAAARTAFLGAYMWTRIGDPDTAQAACDDAFQVLQDRPVWRDETHVYLARNQVAHGNVRGGAQYALNTVKGQSRNVWTTGAAVRDLLDAVPAGHPKTDELHALAGYARSGEMPWERI